MQELNAAKDILKKNLGSKGTKSYSKSQKFNDYMNVKRQSDAFIADALTKLFLLLDVKAYQDWFEQHFSKPFTVDVHRGTHSSILVDVPVPYVEMTAYSDGHAEVFKLKLTGAIFDQQRTPSSLTKKDAPYAYYVQSEVLANGRKQIMQKQKLFKVSNLLPLTHPDSVFPSIKLRKIVKDDSTKGSKLTRKDFATIFQLRYGCENGAGNKNWWLFQFDEDSENVAKGLTIERFTIQRQAFYQFGREFWFKKTTSRFSAWKPSNEIKIDCEFMPETRETADFIESVFAFAKKTRDLKKIAEFVKKGSKDIMLRDRLANES
jgi:hypothetical protein